MKHFLKSVLNNPVRIGGKTVKFIDLGDNLGGLVVDDTPGNAELLTGLADIVKSRRGGVREVTPDEYEETKKKAAERELLLLSLRKASNPLSQPARVAVDTTRPMKLSEVSPGLAPKTGVSTENQPITKGTLADLMKAAPATPPTATPVSQVEAAIAGDPVPAVPDPFDLVLAADSEEAPPLQRKSK